MRSGVKWKHAFTVLGRDETPGRVTSSRLVEVTRINDGATNRFNVQYQDADGKVKRETAPGNRHCVLKI